MLSLRGKEPEDFQAGMTLLPVTSWPERSNGPGIHSQKISQLHLAPNKGIQEIIENYTSSTDQKYKGKIKNSQKEPIMQESGL